MLLILVAEIIAIKIRENNEIKGIIIDNVEIKLSLMADDTTLFVSNITSLERAIEEFQTFNTCSGLKLNIDKTEIIPMGNFRKNIESLR